MDTDTLQMIRSKLHQLIDQLFDDLQAASIEKRLLDGNAHPEYASPPYDFFPETFVGPMSPSGDGGFGKVENLEIANIRNNKALLITLSRTTDYLRGKGIFIDASYQKPFVAWKSVVLRNLYIHDISLDLVASKGDRIHTDGIFIRDGINADVVMENIRIENTDNSTMPFIFESGTYGTVSLTNVVLKNVAHSPYIKTPIQNLIIDGPGIDKISFDPSAIVRTIFLMHGATTDVSTALGANVIRQS